MALECYFHYGAGTVAACKTCGKGLCRDCATYWEPPTCTPCVEKELSFEKRKIKGLVVATSIFFIIAILSPLRSWFLILSIAGIPPIYSAVSLKDPMEDTLFFTYFFWWWYLVKLVIAFIFGSLGFIYVIYKVVTFSKKQMEFNDLFSNSPNYQTKTESAPTGSSEVYRSKLQFSVGSTVYAKYSGDQWFYFATVEGLSDDHASVRYFDNIVETLSVNNLHDINYAFDNLAPQANMQNHGHYYPCSIEQRDNESVTVKYYTNNNTEAVHPEQLRFTDS